jgi:dienelactone hydrolase
MKWSNSKLSLPGRLLGVVAFTAHQGGLAQAVALPHPTGKYNVGFSKHTIEHYNSNDPLAPNNISTAFLATIYYPTLQKPRGRPQPYLDPELAAIMESQWNYAPGFLSTLTSTLQKDAPFLDGSVGEGGFPTLLFGPGGGGPPVQGNTILISDLVSHGYTVVGLDHPFEQPFLRYPNGTSVFGVDIDYNSDPLLTAIEETRMVDAKAFLDYFPELVRKLQAPINTTHIGAFGYSIGGAAAIGSIYHDDRLVSGLNLDGSFFGPPPSLNNIEADAKKPVFLLGNEIHTGEDAQGDSTWYTFRGFQTGYSRTFTINGTTHHDFCDDTFWKTIMPTDPSVGPINGYRQLQIMNAYTKAFFDFTLLDQKSPLLDGPSVQFPEVVFRPKL